MSVTAAGRSAPPLAGDVAFEIPKQGNGAATHRPAGPPRFNNPAVVVQSWYVAAPSRAVRRGRVRSFDLLGRRIALYRDKAGVAHALDAQCPHLGADLGFGRVVGAHRDEVRCPFHHWRFGPDGVCRAAPGHAAVPARRTRVYPVEERWGLVWIFNGPQPRFSLPAPPPGERLRMLRLPSQHIACHPHLVIANGLDAAHFGPLHNMGYAAPPELAVREPYEITVRLRGRPRSRLLRALTGTTRAGLDATFTTIGGTLAWTTVTQPARFHVLFSGRPSASGGCHTQTILFLPPGGGRTLQAAALMYVLLRDDRRILDHLQFRPAFTDQDAALRTFAGLVDNMEVW